MLLFSEIQKYGLLAIVLKPGQSVIDQVFTMIDAGDLDGLKTLTRNIPPKDLVNMKKSGLYSILIYAVDKERRDIVKWLVDEKKADVNLQIRNETPM